MVQIIQEHKKPTFSQQLGQAGLTAINELGKYKEEQEFQKAYPEIAKVPRQYREMALKALQEQKLQESKLKGEAEFDQENYKKIENAFGKNFADIWKAAPQGGKTELMRMGLDAKLRGIDIDRMLKEEGISEIPQAPSVSKDVIEDEELLPKKILEKTPKQLDFDKGLTPRERTARQEKRYEKNLPLFQELEKKRVGLEAEKDALEILEDLSPKISGMARININPSSGELIVPALASKEAQRFVKTINDFTTKAKDTYGSRVTNFELDRFLKRLPTLANSEEGRDEIIRQMQIINEINQIRENSLNEVFEDYGGIRNIDYDQAERLADKNSKSQVENLRKEFTKIDSSLQKREKENIQERKKLTPEGKVSVQKADGRTGYVDQSKLKDFFKLNPGAKIL